MVSINTDAPKARPHEIVEDVWFGDEGNEWQDEGYVFEAGPAPDLLSALLIEDADVRFAHTAKAKLRWLEAGFGEEVWEQIQDRVHDPEDPLRSTHLFEMYNALMQEVASRPPTSPSGSSGTPSRTAGAAKRKPKGATSGV